MNHLSGTAGRLARAGSDLALVVFALVAIAAAAEADVFQLVNGGRIEGRWLNSDDAHPQQYRIELPAGGTVTLEAAQVKEVVSVSPDQAEYERIRPQYPDTAEDQWNLAEWCREHRLDAQRKVHLERVIALDPDHVEARHALHFSRVDGKWQTREEHMAQEGERLYKGKYRTRQEIQLMESKRKTELAEKEWFRKIKLWRNWLGGKHDQEARNNFANISDSAAISALQKDLKNENDGNVRLLYVEVLSKIEAPAAARVLAITSMEDASDEVRLSCLEILAKMKHDDLVPGYISRLRDKNNVMVNRAAVALSYMKDPTSIRPLIDALVTTHEFIVTTGNPGSTSTTFGTGPGGRIGPGMSGSGMSAGGSTKRIKQAIQNQAVLDALVGLTKQNFGFDVGAWHGWLNAQRRSDGMPGTRRD